MNRKMMKYIGLGILSFSILTMGSVLMLHSQADTKNTNALYAYHRYLEGKGDWSIGNVDHYHFMTVDLNNDGSDELIVKNDDAIYAEGSVHIYTYDQNTVKKILSVEDIKIYDHTYIEAEDTHMGYYWGDYFKYTNQVEKIAHYEGSIDIQDRANALRAEIIDDETVYITTYKIGDENVNYDTYTEKVQKFKTGDVITMSDLITNTKTNRDTYLS